ncbi:hypothetical protein F5Y19DRAFT_418939 [Xylariaceae sp. FL1651]|nr:hypothetical protein F5Y19DRAFT_418939 [Xylariaceae sp. FL1651]
MSVIFFHDTVCGHPTARHETHLPPGLCANGSLYCPSFTATLMPACPDGGIPVLFVSPESGCKLPQTFFEPGGGLAVATLRCHWT